MDANKTRRLWAVNVASFLLTVFLALTGLANWLLPTGPAVRGTFWQLARHGLRNVHAIAGVVFLTVVVVHVILHWPYVRRNLERRGLNSPNKGR